MGMKPIFAWNALWSWAGVAANMVAGFVVMPFLVRHLGETNWSLWVLIGSFTGYFTLFDLGVRSSVGRFVAFHRAKNDRVGVDSTLSTAFAILAASGTVALLGTMVLSFLFFRLFLVPEEQVTATRLALLIVGINLAVSLPAALFDATLWAFQRFDALNAVDIVTAAVRTGLTFALIGNGYGLVALALITLGCTLGNAAVKAVVTFRLDPDLRLRRALVERARARELAGFGFWRFIFMTSRIVGAQIAPLSIGAWMAVALIAPYAVAARLMGYACQLVFSASDVLSPLAIRYHAEDSHARQHALFLQGGKMCLALTQFFVLGYLLLGGPLIVLWMGPQFLSSYTLLAILALGELLPASQCMTVNILLGIARHRTIACLNLADNVLTFALIAAWMDTAGLPGVCLALALSGTACRGVGYLVNACRVIEVSLWRYATSAILPALAVAILPAAGMGALLAWRSPTTWVGLFVFGGIYTICYGISCLSLFGYDRVVDRMTRFAGRRPAQTSA